MAELAHVGSWGGASPSGPPPHTSHLPGLQLEERQSHRQADTYPSYCVLGTSGSGIGLENLRGETQA